MQVFSYFIIFNIPSFITVLLQNFKSANSCWDRWWHWCQDIILILCSTADHTTERQKSACVLLVKTLQLGWHPYPVFYWLNTGAETASSSSVLLATTLLHRKHPHHVSCWWRHCSAGSMLIQFWQLLHTSATMFVLWVITLLFFFYSSFILQ